jgi:crotonobetainyl-CoA:carnitine CoA-transferase CaiB-like acyl-CoA transferase/aminoglycoside phosphotransferase (APT) family kinase protein
MTTPDPAAPLRGVRVVSMAEQYPGPYATLILADLGADVILVERPDGGDPARQFAAFFDALNRNKRSVTLDLKAPAGLSDLRRLVAGADVFLEGFRPGTARRLGVGWDDLRAVNPRLVYVSISGYGQTGPYRLRPGHDLSYLAAAGMLFPQTEAAEALPLSPVQVGDLSAGTLAATAVGIALFARERTGEGQYVDVSMFDGLVSWMTTALVPVINGTGGPGLTFEAGYGVYRCGDGRWLSLSVAHEDHFWRRLCGVLDLPAAVAALDAAERRNRVGELRALLAERLGRRGRDAWVAALDAADVPCAPVAGLDEVADDAHVAARGLLVESPAGDGRPARRHVLQPLAVNHRPGPAQVRPAPALGEHSAEVLAEVGAAHPPDAAAPDAAATDAAAPDAAAAMRARLAEWARHHYGDGATVEGVAPMPGNAGISFGFDVVVAGGDGPRRDPLVIRVPPAGVRRKGNTDVLRQVPLLEALAADGVPVPAVRWWGEDERWFGVPYLMVERLPGRSLNVFDPDASFFDLSPGGMDRLFRQAVDALVAVHRLDWRAKLAGWEKPRSLADEIAAWEPILRKGSDGEWIRRGLELRDALLATRPAEPEPGVIHGDFYCNNWVVDAGGRLRALVDWEISAIGPSLLDLGWLCMMNDLQSWAPAQRERLAWMPPVEDIVALYEAAAGRAVPDVAWYRALAGYRLGAITSLNVHLHRSGRRPDPVWEVMAESHPYRVGRALELAQRGRAAAGKDDR